MQRPRAWRGPAIARARRGRTRCSTCSPRSPARSSWCARSRSRSRGNPSVGPFRNVRVGRRHIHHFVPGIVIAFAAGAAAILTRDETIEPWLAVPFGVGMGLTLDESALLLELDDVYWSREGLLSVQITLAVIAMLGALAIALRFLWRGEQAVLEPPPSTGARPIFLTWFDCDHGEAQLTRSAAGPPAGWRRATRRPPPGPQAPSGPPAAPPSARRAAGARRAATAARPRGHAFLRRPGSARRLATADSPARAGPVSRWRAGAAASARP